MAADYCKGPSNNGTGFSYQILGTKCMDFVYPATSLMSPSAASMTPVTSSTAINSKPICTCGSSNSIIGVDKRSANKISGNMPTKYSTGVNVKKIPAGLITIMVSGYGPAGSPPLGKSDIFNDDTILRESPRRSITIPTKVSLKYRTNKSLTAPYPYNAAFIALEKEAEDVALIGIKSKLVKAFVGRELEKKCAQLESNLHLKKRTPRGGDQRTRRSTLFDFRNCLNQDININNNAIVANSKPIHEDNTTRTNNCSITTPSSSFVDPFINASPSFLKRLSELSALEVDTISWEKKHSKKQKSS